MVDYEPIMEDNAKKRSGVADNVSTIDQSLRHMSNIHAKGQPQAPKSYHRVFHVQGTVLGPLMFLIYIQQWYCWNVSLQLKPAQPICQRLAWSVVLHWGGHLVSLGGRQYLLSSRTRFPGRQIFSETTGACSTWALISAIIRDGSGVCFVVPNIDYETPSGVCIIYDITAFFISFLTAGSICL